MKHIAALILLAATVTCMAKGHGNPAALAKYRAEKAAATAKPYTVPSAGKWSKPAGAPAPVSGK